MRAHDGAGLVDIELDVDAAEFGRIEADLEAGTAGLELAHDLERHLRQVHLLDRRLVGGMGSAGDGSGGIDRLGGRCRRRWSRRERRGRGAAARARADFGWAGGDSVGLVAAAAFGAVGFGSGAGASAGQVDGGVEIERGCGCGGGLERRGRLVRIGLRWEPGRGLAGSGRGGSAWTGAGLADLGSVGLVGEGLEHIEGHGGEGLLRGRGGGSRLGRRGRRR